MANWCRYCKGSYPKYWCEVTNDYIPYGIVERSCKNNGYKCSYYHISTCIGNILNKGDNDKVLNNIKSLRDEFMINNNKYNKVLRMYDSIGPVIAEQIERDSNKEENAKEYYDKVLVPISRLVSNKKYEIALDHYSYFTRILINKYGLNDLFESLENCIPEFDVEVVKKEKKIIKTLDL